jgi:hypothetical protein
MSNGYKAGMILLGALILVLLLYAMKLLIWVAVTVLFYMLVYPLASIVVVVVVGCLVSMYVYFRYPDRK